MKLIVDASKKTNSVKILLLFCRFYKLVLRPIHNWWFWFAHRLFNDIWLWETHWDMKLASGIWQVDAKYWKYSKFLDATFMMMCFCSLQIFFYRIALFYYSGYMEIYATKLLVEIFAFFLDLNLCNSCVFKIIMRMFIKINSLKHLSISAMIFRICLKTKRSH